MTDDLHRLVARRWRIGAVLKGVMMLGYFGFILLVAFDKDTAGTLLADGRVSVGIVLGALVIVLAPVLTAIYVRWANRRYDPVIARLRTRREESDAADATHATPVAPAAGTSPAAAPGSEGES
jgi:uncharacterized membrane protein (DUF485 family)